MKTLIMKFGGAAVATPDHFSRIAKIILARKKHYHRIVIVVSAMGKTTDQLIALAKQVHPNPPQREYDMLVSTGERISISLLAMALAALEQEAVSFTGSQSGIITCPNHTDARIIEVRPHRLKTPLEQGKVVIIAGFQGVSRLGEITTLGRGGSDTTAVALAVALQAEHVEFYKDVQGIYDEDPMKNPNANLLPTLTYDEALQITLKGAKILSSRSLQLAQKNKLPLYIHTFHEPFPCGTFITDLTAVRPNQPMYEEEFAKLNRD